MQDQVPELVGRIEEKFEAGDVVDHDTLVAKGIIKKNTALVKVLGDGDTLYVGSASSLRSRVASYYSRSEKRSKVQRMVSLAAGVRSFKPEYMYQPASSCV